MAKQVYLDDIVPNNKINFIKLKRAKNKKFNKTYSKRAKKILDTIGLIWYNTHHSK